MQKLDLTGKKIGKWTVGEPFKKGTKIFYHCKCECGTERDVYGSRLNKGTSLSCGCSKIGSGENFLGKRFGHLLVVGSKVKNKRTVWICKCDCGNEKEVESNHLPLLTSCGCRPDSGKKIKASLEQYCVDGTYVPGLVRKDLNRNNTSGATGVRFRPDRGKWQAFIKFQGKYYTLGSYWTKEEAIEARRIGEEKFFGPYLK